MSKVLSPLCFIFVVAVGSFQFAFPVSALLEIMCFSFSLFRVFPLFVRILYEVENSPLHLTHRLEVSVFPNRGNLVCRCGVLSTGSGELAEWFEEFLVADLPLLKDFELF